MLVGELLRSRQRRADVLWLDHLNRLAAEAFRDAQVIDAVSLGDVAVLGLLGVDVVEAQRHEVVHVEVPLRLADQPQIGVVHDHMDVGQVELRPDREFLDEELEVVVSRQPHHGGVGVGGDDTEGGGHRPPEWSGLTAVDPVPWFVHLQELSARDL